MEQVIFILLTILLVIIWLFDFPFYRQLNNLSDDFNRAKKDLSLQFKQGNSYEKALTDYQGLYDKIPPFSKVFLADGSQLTLITKLENLATKHNLVQKINLGTQKESLADKIIKLGLNLQLSGSFENLVAYLAELKSLKTSLSVIGLDLKKINNDLLELNLNTQTFWLE